MSFHGAGHGLAAFAGRMASQNPMAAAIGFPKAGKPSGGENRDAGDAAGGRQMHQSRVIAKIGTAVPQHFGHQRQGLSSQNRAGDMGGQVMDVLRFGGGADVDRMKLRQRLQRAAIADDGPSFGRHVASDGHRHGKAAGREAVADFRRLTPPAVIRMGGREPSPPSGSGGSSPNGFNSASRVSAALGKGISRPSFPRTGFISPSGAMTCVHPILWSQRRSFSRNAGSSGAAGGMRRMP